MRSHEDINITEKKEADTANQLCINYDNLII